MNLKELRQQRASKASRGKAATTEFNTLSAKTERTAEEDAKLSALDAELEALAAEVEALDAQIDREERTARRAGLFNSAGDGGRQAAGTAARTSGEPDPERTFGFRNMAEFAMAVQASSRGGALSDSRLNAALPSSYNAEGGSAGEGFMVPPEYREAIWELVFAGDDLLNRITPEPTAANFVQLVKDETTPWGTSGVQAYWRTEGAQMTASKLATKGVQVPLNELYAFVVATDELLSDAPRLADRLTRQAARAINWTASDAIMWGDGVGKPLGFMNSPALVTQAKESGQAADTINATNVAKMFSRLIPGNVGGSFWMANPDTLPQIMTMTIGDQPIWTPPAQGFKEAPGGFLLGRPLNLSEHADTVGDAGDLTLVDPMGYYAAVKQGGGIDFATSIHLFFDYGAQAFRWTFRIGGTPILSAAVSGPRSSNSKSHFVALADRT